MGIKESLSDVSVIVYILVMLFGMSSWIDINGIFVELPLMVNELPEGWDLPSYIVLIIQIANIGPLAYTIGHKVAPTKIKEWPVVYIIITIGAVSCLLLVFFWDYTSYIRGEEHSTGLLSLTACLALVDCTSSVVYLPYMAYFKPQYLSSFYIGEGLSGLVPGLLGVAQGVGGEAICVNTSLNDNDTEWGLIPEYPPPRFSVEVFFGCLCILMCISGISFTLLHFAPYCQQEKLCNTYDVAEVKSAETNQGFEDELKSHSFNRNVDGGTLQNYNSISNAHVTDLKSDCYKNEVMYQNKAYESDVNALDDKKYVEQRDKTNFESDVQISNDNTQTGFLSRFEFVLLMVYLGFVNCMTNGVLPSTLTYSCLPYGNQAYGLATRIATVANPLACFFALFVPRISIVATSLILATGTGLCGYQLYLAAESPTPPLQDETMGVVLVVTSYVIIIALFSYIKVAIATISRDDGGRKSLLWCGGVTQIGGFVGAIVSFVCINIYDLFESAPACPT